MRKKFENWNVDFFVHLEDLSDPTRTYPSFFKLYKTLGMPVHFVKALAE